MIEEASHLRVCGVVETGEACVHHDAHAAIGQRHRSRIPISRKLKVDRKILYGGVESRPCSAVRVPEGVCAGDVCVW